MYETYLIKNPQKVKKIYTDIHELVEDLFVKSKKNRSV
jgi:hypothetical protein